MKTEEQAAAPAVLLQITDPHLHANAAGKMRGVVTYETFVAVLEQARRDAHWPPDAIVATGDLVQDESREGYERFRSALNGFDLPVYCIPGNHDDPELLAAVLSDRPFQVGGHATVGAWRLVLLDTFAPGEDSGRVGEAGLADLDRLLTRNPDQPTLICLHHQPVPMGSDWLDSVGLVDATAFLAITDRHPQVRGIVWGHVHQACDRRRGDVRLLSTPSTCAQFVPESRTFALDSAPPGYRWITLHPDGSIETTVGWL
jgi:Icc protein